jgi:predicted DNA-binding protein (UPF0251 family)
MQEQPTVYERARRRNIEIVRAHATGLYRAELAARFVVSRPLITKVLTQARKGSLPFCPPERVEELRLLATLQPTRRTKHPDERVLALQHLSRNEAAKLLGMSRRGFAYALRRAKERKAGMAY